MSVLACENLTPHPMGSAKVMCRLSGPSADIKTNCVMHAFNLPLKGVKHMIMCLCVHLFVSLIKICVDVSFLLYYSEKCFIFISGYLLI